MSSSNLHGHPPEAPSHGVTWGGVPMHAKRAMTVAVASLVAAGLTGPATASAATLTSSADPVSVIVREAAGSGDAPERAVSAFGGSVTRQLGIIGGFTAQVPADRIGALRGVAGVRSVSENASLALQSTDVQGQAAQPGSLHTIANEVTGASAMWDAGFTGEGVDVAVIDSGAVPVDGFTAPGKLVFGPDLSFEVGTPLENLDTNGHGTHMAGIIAGRDDAAAAPYSGDSSNYVGMAPDARIVSIKVADALGHTDVSQAIAAIDWVVEHGDDNGLNVRVLNMSFGTDGVQSYQLDPLAYAAEQAWHAGVVVVVAVGNEGLGKVNNPATDPYVIAVGSNNANGTADTADDVVSSFSNNGDGTRNPDVLAPGERVVSLRSPNSYLDQTAPGARQGEKLFRGSGTSQAAAVVSGAAALLIDQRPEITPDEVKALLTGTAKSIPGATAAQQGAGLIDLATAMNTATPENAVQTHARSTGAGSLDEARGSVIVEVDGEAVTGEVDVTGESIEDSTAESIAEGVTEVVEEGAKETVEVIAEMPVEEQVEVIEELPAAQQAAVIAEMPVEEQAAVVEQAELAGVTWSGVTWSGVTWSGVTWSGVTWSGVTWSGVTWSGVTWSGVTWSGVTWSGVTWSGVTWSGVTWSGSGWA
ncbi:S8 family serine peptidase [Blastococcus tunisiensis]|uniref:Serine protease, subtilisin family n=1 Tax=Blastococcus tunisiensis TaxID=1798228 RepID=A0A1I2EGH5_9ACTN|nr:S8 family serine peptidase [Blastococcus sp. DSM 46838]SFE91839.1 Serine protease, subtilisin family [Blastococcus sp. DSM 46838]